MGQSASRPVENVALRAWWCAWGAVLGLAVASGVTTAASVVGVGDGSGVAATGELVVLAVVGLALAGTGWRRRSGADPALAEEVRVAVEQGHVQRWPRGVGVLRLLVGALLGIGAAAGLASLVG